MRPIRLTVQGLTSYRDGTSVDFSDLDLFAITGPTGAGKSSLVDAITYALYGQVPRVGKTVKELISQGADRLKVELEFSVGGARYRIHRSTARKGTTPVQVERCDPATGDWLPEDADRVREVNRFIEELLRMDYEAFIRSVLLPQGQFQEFLAGDRDQRRKVLDGLLQLGIYTVMGQKANQIATQRTFEADAIKTRLDTELQGATPEALAAARADLADLEARAEALKAERAALELARTSAEALTLAREQESAARSAAGRAQEELAEATKLRDEGQKVLADLDARLQALRDEAVAVAYDADAHLQLNGVLPLARQRDALLSRMEDLKRQLESAGPEARALSEAKRAADEALTIALREAEAARDAYDEARRVNAAVLLRQGLTAGDPCPVCGQAVRELPSGTHLQLDELKAAADTSRIGADGARVAREEADRQVALKEQAIEKLDKDFVETAAQREGTLKEIATALPDPETPLKEITARLQEMERAKSRISDIDENERKLGKEREERAEAIAHAQQDVTRLETEHRSYTGDAEKAAKAATEAESAVRTAAAAHGWAAVLEAIDGGGSVADVLGRELETTRTTETDVNQRIGAGRTAIAQIESDIELANTLRGEEREHRTTATLARDLATLLRADRFPAFIRDEAMKTLAAGGSEWLKKVSQGRYDLIVEGQDFEVEDQWNAGERRSVKTLSGGETFMASLSLALALAEQLPGLAGEAGASALESLFIDEGFSNLDTQTLDDVASALEVLGQDRQRLIGVITHVPALAERMPARITVHKSQSGSTVTVE